ncbi:putative cardiolipin synthetase [Leptomonas seymouri]|uniref:Putative cardiolipin synthetase n=1 Tax=Leptomonas seymouri TaxID=5684 RepID=A0A0N1IC19_LEPSE|nr:putative cardiolipin synthetase [Leptomonas seymouri]|eukprot:KPI90458.1 putative cardiolipin synthetase [Leptomonas seymouri]
MAPKQNFRALIQNVGLSKVKNTPKYHIQNVAQEAFQSMGKTTAGAAAASTPAAEASSSSPSRPGNTTTAAEGSGAAAPITPFNTSERKPFLSIFGPYPWIGEVRGGDHGRMLSLLERLQQLRVQFHTTANVREKLQQAFQAAVGASEQLLTSAARTLESSSAAQWTPTPLSSSGGRSAGTKKNQKTKNDAHHDSHSAAGAASAAASFYLDRVQSTYRDAKRYYGAVPFDERWDDILSSLAVLGKVSQGNTVIPLHDSAMAFENMWAAVDGAKQRVHWQTYICKDDFIGQATVHKLVQAHQRGCDTELLYDCGGNISGRGRLTEELKQCGAKVIPYRPFFRSFLTYFVKGLDWRRSPGLRNHRKILLVDTELGFCGGLNIGNEYCGKTAGGTGKFRDTHCSVTGPAAEHLAAVYRDTKQPQPWKYGWRRWRQIASQQIRRRMGASRARMQRNELYRTFQAERRRSGRRLQDIPSASVKMMRLRWQKQKKQLQTLVQWSKEGTTDADLDVEATEIAQKMLEEQERSAATDSAADIPAKPSLTAVEVETLRAQLQSKHSGAETAAEEQHEGAAKQATYGGKSPGPKTSAMRRKLMAARRDALYRVTDLPHKRAYTDMLRRMPLLDGEPVPEAEMYLLRRQPTTQILSCNPRYRDYSIQYALWQVTRKCHRRIWITTPYYLPTRKLFTALVQAAGRGVDVRLLAGSNQTTDPWFMWHASNYITERLLSAGVKIYEYRGEQIMHAKTVVVDSMWSSIGSYNWDLMSNRNLEVCLSHLDLAVAKEMETQFLKDLSESVEIRLEDHRQRSLWLRFTSWLFYNCVFLLDRITFRSFANKDVVDVPGVPRD